MEKLVKETFSLVQDYAFYQRLKWNISWKDIFPASKNHAECVEILAKVATEHANSSDELVRIYNGVGQF